MLNVPFQNMLGGITNPFYSQSMAGNQNTMIAQPSQPFGMSNIFGGMPNGSFNNMHQPGGGMSVQNFNPFNMQQQQDGFMAQNSLLNGMSLQNMNQFNSFGGQSLMSNSFAGTANVNEKIRSIHHQLMLIIHSINCDKMAAEGEAKNMQYSCFHTYCKEMKATLNHVQNCKIFNCQFKHCSSTKDLIYHWNSCQNIKCVFCGPLRFSNFFEFIQMHLRCVLMDVRSECLAGLGIITFVIYLRPT